MEKMIQDAPIVLVVALLVVGFVLLIKGADYFVEGSSSLAKMFRVPPIIIGLTIVAMGTSLPETSVSVAASIAQNNELAVSNAVGSNIFNLIVVIGFCAILTPVAVSKETVKRDIPFSAFCAILLLALGLWGLGDKSNSILGHLDGVLLLIFFAMYLVVLIRSALRSRRETSATEVEGDGNIKSIPMSLVCIVLGGAAIAFGGNLTVNTASRIATDCGMSQTLVGLTIVSIGTSLPELVTSIVAARKNEVDMALGNAIGSNIFNILMVLGVASAISPITFLQENIIDICVLFVLSLIVWIFAMTRHKIGRLEGVLMILMYAGYAAYIFMR